MEQAQTPRCTFCGLIEVLDGWHFERRKRPVPYAYTACTTCSVIEDQLGSGLARRRKDSPFRQGGRAIANWVLHRLNS
jgi:hypothetical protein